MESKYVRRKLGLPDDIIAEILQRLPVKSLLKFKCLSRSWCSFISSKSFAKTHLEYSAKSTPLADHDALLISTSPSKENFIISHCLVSSLFSQQPIDFVQIEFDYPVTKFGNRIVGCCNGLCCILIDSKYFTLWNPSTRKSHKLPPVLKEYLYVDIEGFGYDESNDDYKVLAQLVTRSPFGCCELAYVFRLYSLKKNSWKTVDDLLGPGPLEGRGALVNGKLHWAIRTPIKSGPGPCVFDLNIVSFDLGSEAAGVVEQPSSADGNNRLYPAMGVLQGCLSVLCDTRNDSAEIWVMKEYGVKESWSRVMIVPCIGCPDAPRIPFSPLCISEEGEVLVSKEKSLFIYNPDTDSRRPQQIDNISRLCQFDIYIQSLVSPFPMISSRGEKTKPKRKEGRLGGRRSRTCNRRDPSKSQ